MVVIVSIQTLSSSLELLPVPFQAVPTAMSQLLSARENRCSSCHIPGGTACLAASLEIPCVGWLGAVWGERRDASHGAGLSKGGWLGCVQQGEMHLHLWGERSPHLKLVTWGWRVRWERTSEICREQTGNSPTSRNSGL